MKKKMCGKIFCRSTSRTNTNTNKQTNKKECMVKYSVEVRHTILTFLLAAAASWVTNAIKHGVP